MLYYDINERKGKVTGAIAAGIYLVVVVVLLLVIKFDMSPPDEGEGILIDFGNSETGSGLVDPANNVAAQSNPQTTQNTAPEEILTQDFEDAPEIVAQPEPNRQQQRQPTNQPSRTQNPQPQQQAQTPVEEPQRQVNQNALFPGMTQGSTSASEGSVGGPGNQGSLEGSPGGSHDGTGGGSGGHGFSLAGRSIRGRLPEPVQARNKAGRVIVEIVVNNAGNVVQASYRARGSTTNDSELVTAALNAARKAKFNDISGENNQTGTITYNFRLN